MALAHEIDALLGRQQAEAPAGSMCARVHVLEARKDALVAQVSVITLYFVSDIGFLWFNVIGCSLVVVVAVAVQAVIGDRPPPSKGEYV